MITLIGIQQNLNRPFSYSIAAWLLAYYDDPTLWKEDDRLQLLQAVQQASKDFESNLQLPPAVLTNRLDPREMNIDRRSSLTPVPLFTDYDVLKEALAKIGTANSLIRLVETAEEADYIYTCVQVQKFLQLPLHQHVCQFPYESAFVRKDLLPLTVRKFCYQEGGIPPAWWLPCYDLSTEFHLFYTDCQNRLLNSDKLPNRWIIKPAQGTRSQGHHILHDEQANDHGLLLNRAARFAPLLTPYILAKIDHGTLQPSEEVVYDRVVQLLVDHPLLVNNCKFDMRYFVFVRSFRPFEAYLHTFHYARLANKEYSVLSLDDEEVALTVSAYSEDPSKAEKQRRINCHDLLAALHAQYGEGVVDYPILQASVLQLMKDLFGKGGAEIGGPWPNSDAYYSIDIIFDGSDMNQVQPKLLEVNFMGDWHGIENVVSNEAEYLQWVQDLLQVLVIAGPHSDDDDVSVALSSNPRLIPLHEQQQVMVEVAAADM